MTEGVGRSGRLAANRYETRAHQRAQGLLEYSVVDRNDASEQIEIERSPDRRADLRHVLGRTEPVETGFE